MSLLDASEVEVLRREWEAKHRNTHGVIILPPGASYQELPTPPPRERNDDYSDSWVEVTQFGDPAPRFLLARDGVEAAIEQAKAEYVYDRISLDELEARVEAALRHRLIKPAMAIRLLNGQDVSEHRWAQDDEGLEPIPTTNLMAPPKPSDSAQAVLPPGPERLVRRR